MSQNLMILGAFAYFILSGIATVILGKKSIFYSRFKYGFFFSGFILLPLALIGEVIQFFNKKEEVTNFDEVINLVFILIGMISLFSIEAIAARSAMNPDVTPATTCSCTK